MASRPPRARLALRRQTRLRAPYSAGQRAIPARKMKGSRLPVRAHKWPVVRPRAAAVAARKAAVAVVQKASTKGAVPGRAELVRHRAQQVLLQLRAVPRSRVPLAARRSTWDPASRRPNGVPTVAQDRTPPSAPTAATGGAAGTALLHPRARDAVGTMLQRGPPGEIRRYHPRCPPSLRSRRLAFRNRATWPAADSMLSNRRIFLGREVIRADWEKKGCL